MDRFSKVITTNVMNIKAELPVPNRPEYSRLDISFDKFNEFINRYLSRNIRLPLLQATIYDEDDITSQEEFNLRYHFLRKINELNFKNISFILSDSTMPIYNAIMERIGWKHADKTELFMSIDRNPKERKDLRLQSAQGKIMMPEESLIWVPATIIHKLEGKVDEETLKKAIELKEIVLQYYLRLNSLYHIEDFTEFDKIWLAYDFIKRHISFAKEATRYENGRQVLYNPNNRYDFVSEPLGTYQHKRGVCEGQARFMQALLNNQYIRSDTVAINGECPLGNHVWVGSVVDNRLYQTCVTQAGPFKDLDTKGYVPDVSEVYPRIYETSSLSNQELMQVQSHIRRLRR